MKKTIWGSLTLSVSLSLGTAACGSSDVVVEEQQTLSEGDTCGSYEYARSHKQYEGGKYTFKTCAVGLRCAAISASNTPNDGAGRCSNKPSIGESCDQAKGCASGLFCVRAVGATVSDGGTSVGICAEPCEGDDGCPKCGGAKKGCCKALVDVPVKVCTDPS